MNETQRQVATKLGSTESRSVNLQQKLEITQNELMEAQRKYEEDRIAKNEEIELIMNDLERANHNYELSQKQIEYLQEQIKNSSAALPEMNVNDGSTMQMSETVSTIQTEIHAKERELAQLTTELAKLEETHSVEVVNYQRQITELSEKNRSLSTDLRSIEGTVLTFMNVFVIQIGYAKHNKAKLVDQKDYADIKRECEILKATQFSGIDETKLESQTLEGIVI